MRSVVLILALLTGAAHAQQHDPDQLLQTAIEAQQRGDYQTAIRDYRQLLELRPESFQAKVNLGAALAHVGDFDAAITQYQSALASSPQNAKVKLNLGLAYYKKGDFKNARGLFEALHTATPKDPQVAVLLGDCDLRLNDAQAAVALLTPMEPANADNLDIEYVLGSALIRAGQRREGVSHLEKVAIAGNSADAYMLAGSTLLQLNEFEQARHDLDEALRLDPKLPGIQTLAGTARDKTGDTSAAEVAFRDALKVNPDDFDANLYLGAILYKRREMDEAKTYLDRAIKLQPASSMARYEYAMYKSTSGQYESAAADLETLVKDDPTWLLPHVELASLYYRLHRPSEGARERQIVDKMTAEQQAQGAGKP